MNIPHLIMTFLTLCINALAWRKEFTNPLYRTLIPAILNKIQAPLWKLKNNSNLFIEALRQKTYLVYSKY